jgi:putative SOS response-associated peptidase YedK
VPFRYTVDGGAPFAFAGLWCWAKIEGEWLASATILTTTANAVCAPVHDRMPCVLPGPDAEAAWLSPDVDVAAALDLLAPLPDARCTAAPANPAVNKAGVEGPELLVPPAAGEEPGQLSFA